MRIMLLFSLLWCHQLWSNAFEEGVQAYKTGDYATARARFEAAYTEVPTAAAAYNVGCAAYRLQHTGEAVVWLRRALLLDPGHANAAANLALVRKTRTDRLESLPPAPLDALAAQVHPWASPDVWGYVASGALVVLGAMAWLRNKVPVATTLAWISAGVALAAGALGALSARGAQQLSGGVLMSPSAYVKAEPRTSATDLLIIHEGTEFAIVGHQPDWWEIALPDGRRGWLPAADGEEIEGK